MSIEQTAKILQGLAECALKQVDEIEPLNMEETDATGEIVKGTSSSGDPIC